MAETKEPEHNQGLITPDEMRTAIEVSGFLLEGRVARVMAERGFFVEPNSFRTAPTVPGGTIEIDVVGRYFEWVNESNRDMVVASVLVECKNNAQPFAFFTRTQQVTEINASRVRYGGFPSFSMDQETKIQVPMDTLLGMKNWHHYCEAGEVATQFCSFVNSGKKWKVEPMKHYSESFSALALATATDTGGDCNLQSQNIEFQLTYPIAVFQGPIYNVHTESGKAMLESVEHLQLHHSVSAVGRVVPVQIDIVTEKAFPKLIEIILGELRVCRDHLNGQYERLLNSALDQKRVALQNAMRAHFKGHRGE